MQPERPPLPLAAATVVGDEVHSKCGILAWLGAERTIHEATPGHGFLLRVQPMWWQRGGGRPYRAFLWLSPGAPVFDFPHALPQGGCAVGGALRLCRITCSRVTSGCRVSGAPSAR